MNSQTRQEPAFLSSDLLYLQPCSSAAATTSSSSSFQSARSSPEPYSESIFDTDTDNDDCESKELLNAKMEPIQARNLIAPAIPKRSDLRRSQIGMLKTPDEEERPLCRQAVEHERYLSSEEDASSSADEYSDFELDSDGEGSASPSSSRSSGEITARAVSVIYSGKPIMINLPSRPRSASPVSVSNNPFGRLRRMPADPCLGMDRRSSTSSETSFLYSSGSSTATPEKKRPAFLKMSPFQAKESESNDILRPKTPTALVKRAFGLSKKPKSAVIPGANASRESLSFSRRSSSLSQPQLQEPTVPRVPAKYHEIMEAAKRNARAQASAAKPLPSSAPMNKSIMGLGRTKSFKATERGR